MNADTVFTICNFSVVPGWILLTVAPRWKGTQWLVHFGIVPLALAVVYLCLAATSFIGPDVEGGFGSLEGVAALFANPNALLAGWIHYLVFDLFVGAWEVRDARRRGIPHLALLPCLILTLALGPMGLLLYLALRLGLRRELSLEE